MNSLSVASGLLPAREVMRIVTLVLFIFIMSMSGIFAADNSSIAFDQIDSEAALARLSDAELRQLLVQRLEQDNASQSSQDRRFDPSRTTAGLQQDFLKVKLRLIELFGIRDRLPEEMQNTWSAIASARDGCYRSSDWLWFTNAGT